MPAHHTLILPLVFCLLVLAGVLVAGPLDPPAGPVQPSYKTLDDIDTARIVNDINTPQTPQARHRISSPGRYKLVGNVVAPDGLAGILIASSHVELDLNGFVVEGDGLFSPITLDGVTTDGQPRTNITIRNGVVRGFDGTGIDLDNTDTVVLEGVTVAGSGGDAIVVDRRATVARCVASGNAQSGLRIDGDEGTVSDCSFSNNLRGVLHAQSATALTITNTLANENTFEGFDCSQGVVIRDSIASDNGSSGFRIDEGGAFIGCTAIRNTLTGFILERSTIEGSNAIENERGISAFNGSVVRGCTADSNTIDGISASTGTQVIDATARFNGRHGVSLSSSSASRACIAQSNGRTTADGAGFFVAFDGNLLEGNHAVNNDLGFRIEGTDNALLRNTAVNSSVHNYSVTQNGNIYLVVAASQGGTMNGSSGGASPGSTDPNANLAY